MLNVDALLCMVWQDDVSGDYKEILLALLGERPPPAPTAEEEDVGEPELEEVEEEHIEVWAEYIRIAILVSPGSDIESMLKLTGLCTVLLGVHFWRKIIIAGKTSETILLDWNTNLIVCFVFLRSYCWFICFGCRLFCKLL